MSRCRHRSLRSSLIDIDDKMTKKCARIPFCTFLHGLLKEPIIIPLKFKMAHGRHIAFANRSWPYYFCFRTAFLASTSVGFRIVSDALVFIRPTHTLVCVLWYIPSAMSVFCFFLYSSGYLGDSNSDTDRRDRRKSVHMVELCPRTVFSHLLATPLGVTKRGVKKGARVDHFGLPDTDFCHLTANISKTVCRSVHVN